jgi:hypothetical protein
MRPPPGQRGAQPRCHRPRPGQQAGPGGVQGRRGRVGPLADPNRPAACPPGRRADQRPRVPRRSGTDPSGPGRRPRPGQRAGPAVVPACRPPVPSDNRVDAAPVAPLSAPPRSRGWHQHANAACPLPPRLGPLAGALRSAQPRGGRPPRRAARPDRQAGSIESLTLPCGEVPGASGSVAWVPWWAREVSNLRPLPCEPRAATTPDLAAPAVAPHPRRRAVLPGIAGPAKSVRSLVRVTRREHVFET